MSARTVTVTTGDRGPVTVPEPRWCTFDHQGVRLAYLTDLQHASSPLYVHVRVPGGVAEVLQLEWSHTPFAERPGGRRPYGVVTLGEGRAWETTLRGVLLLSLRLLLAAPRVALVALRLGVRRLGGGR